MKGTPPVRIKPAPWWLHCHSCVQNMCWVRADDPSSEGPEQLNPKYWLNWKCYLKTVDGNVPVSVCWLVQLIVFYYSYLFSVIELNHWGTIPVYIEALVNKTILIVIPLISCHIPTRCCLTASSSEKDKPERLVLLDKLECLHWKWWGWVVELKWQRDFPSLSTSGISSGGPGSGDTHCVCLCAAGRDSRAELGMHLLSVTQFIKAA